MSAEFLDTTVIVRYLTQDSPAQAARARRLLQDVRAGARRVTTSEGILVESVQVLSSPRLYNLPRGEIRDALRTILGLRGFTIPGKRTYVAALDLYVQARRLSFVDALSVVQVRQRKLAGLVSFDRGFDGIPGVTRREP